MNRKVIGVCLIVVGVALGLYVGFWLCFVGGIIQVVHAVRAPELDAMQVAFGIGRVVFTGLFGWVSAALLVIPGAVLLRD